MSKTGACRLAVIASHPVQYFTPVYRRLASEPGMDVEVFFCRDFGVRARYDKQFGRAVQWNIDLLGGYRHRFLRNISPIRDTFNPLHAINPGVFFHTLRGFDAVWVQGYVYPSNWLAVAGASLRGARVLLRSELRDRDERVPRWYDGLRDLVIRQWVRRSHALLYIGELNRQAYLRYGGRPERMFFSPYSVAVERITDARARRRSTRAAALRRWGVPDDRVVVLFVGKLIPRKHPEAVLALCEDPVLRRSAHVVFAGSGPMEEGMKDECRRMGFENASFLGFVNQQELPDVYAAADVFVMPSENEPWGLVLNEAMAAALPSVVSDDVGAAADLVTPGTTGYVFEKGDWSRMVEHTMRLVRDPGLRERIGRAAQERSLHYSYEATAQGVLDALRSLGLVQGMPGRGIAAAG